MTRTRWILVGLLLAATACLDRSCAWAAPPSEPTHVIAAADSCVWFSQDQCVCPVRIYWDPPADDGGYPIVRYSLYEDGSLSELDAGSWSNIQLEHESTIRSWSVTATNQNEEEGAMSSQVTVETPACSGDLRPTTPGEFSATALDCDSVGLAWLPSTCLKLKPLIRTSAGWRIQRNGLGAYRVFRTTPEGPNLGSRLSFIAWLGSGAMTFLDTPVPPGLYRYGIEAFCNSGTLSPLAVSEQVEVPSCP